MRQLCIRQIRKYTTPETTILDVGCGSGIGNAGFEIRRKIFRWNRSLDPCAIEATYENMKSTESVKGMYEVMIGNIIDDKDVQDKVSYGNMTLSLQIFWQMFSSFTAPVIVDQLKDSGIYITSELLMTKKRD